MMPFAVNGLAGWLHVAPAPRRDTAILFCPALSYDMLDSYHSLRVLADRLAQAGYPAMRFAYPGTGDSSDIASPPGAGDVWGIWQQSVHDTADLLRDMAGAKRLVFCGLRMGATMAAFAAPGRADVAGLILLEPVPRGRSYLRQMQVEAALHFKETMAENGGLNFHELMFDAAAARRISDLDLRQVAPRADQKIALFMQTESAPLKHAAAAWAALGAAVETHSFAGLEPLLCHETQGDKLPPDPAPIIAWLTRNFPEAGQIPPFNPPQPARLELPGCAETPLHFGPDGALFGILCRPGGLQGDLAVLIVNTGRHPRHGVGRFGVEFARQLAAAGIASLRIDFSGLGDSRYLLGDADLRSDVFEDERSGDISAALDELARLGFSRFAVQGLCAGAYHAFHGGIADARIGYILAVNLPLFVWQPGDTITAAKQRTYTLSHYRDKLVDKGMWLKLLRGQSDLTGIITGQLKRVYERASRGWAQGDAPAGYAGAGKFARRHLAALAARGAKTLFLFNPGNVGVYEMELQFGKNGAGLREFPGASIDVMPQLDEILARRETRQMAAARMIEFLTVPAAAKLQAGGHLLAVSSL